jgi:hypothetical protein
VAYFRVPHRPRGAGRRRGRTLPGGWPGNP